MKPADRTLAAQAIRQHCGGAGPLPTTAHEIEEIERVTRRHLEAEAEFRALSDRYHAGVPYWMDFYVRGVVNADGSYNQ
jgi:hypothetical protein